jgi:hypothetical protein
MLGDRVGVRAAGRHHGNTARCRRVQIDAVHARAMLRDDFQIGRAFEHASRRAEAIRAAARR